MATPRRVKLKRQAVSNVKARERFLAFKPRVIGLMDDGLGSFRIAEEIGLPYSTVKGWVSRIREESENEGAEVMKVASAVTSKGEEKPPRIGAHFAQKGNLAMATLTDVSIRTLDDLIAACQIDMNIWECVQFDAKCWEMGRKAKETDMVFDAGVASGFSRDTGKVFVQPLFSVMGRFRVRQEKGLEEMAGYFRKLMAEIKPPTWRRNKISTGENTLELMIPDLHLGQRSWDPETGTGDYDIKIACDLLRQSVIGMVSEAGNRVKRICFPIGNDFFNVDSHDNTTTKGTPQDEDGRWQKSFREGAYVLIDIITSLAAKYEVDVMVVPGNHDVQRSFYLGEVLAMAFRDDERVKVDNSPLNRKYRLHGCTLVGYTHGDQESPKDLPMIMAHQVPDLWAMARYREWHHGHLHQERNNEVGAIKLRHFPALVAPSTWAAKRGYVMSVRQACAIEYSDAGPIRQYNWYPSMANSEFSKKTATRG